MPTMIDTPRMLLVLSENWTLTGGRPTCPPPCDGPARPRTPLRLRHGQRARRAGPGRGRRRHHGQPSRLRPPGNQDPYTPWPNSLLLLSAIASVTERLRLAAAAVLAPLRHPLLMARELALSI
ncbi:LLM class flavin-dependent oxidoreductase [Streptomyces lusitanus]|uniref:LLM class flavin-dependent oxidoreductase n=1 Tax=Streptomyces lusitanus TaxID=68232 RepID=UPI00362FD736